MTKLMEWAISPSKLCNLRCAYCYEWNQLADPSKMSPELVRRFLTGVRDYHLQLEEQFSEVATGISWLGGEPLILPIGYLEEIMAIEHEVLGGLLARGVVTNVVQTNLYRLTEPVIEFLHRHDWKVGVSFDVARGVRLSVNGHETEERVSANIRRLRAEGIDPGAIMVLAGHTVPRIVEIYDHFCEQGFTRVRLSPLFPGPAERPLGALGVSTEAIAGAMCRLFVHWIESGAKIQLEPLRQYLENILRRMLGGRGELYDRSKHGEGVIVVDTNGDLYQLLDAYEPGCAMGNVGREDIRDILDSSVSAWTLERDRALRDEICVTCEYSGVCNGTPILESPRDEGERGRCGVAHTVHEFIEDYLRKNEIDELAVLHILGGSSSSPGGGAA